MSANLIKASARRMYFVPEGQHDRSLARSAWKGAHRENRPVGYGMIGHSYPRHPRSISRRKCGPYCRIRNLVTPIIESVRTPARIRPYPTGRLFWVALSQALRAWLRSHRPSGTKAIARRRTRIRSALMGVIPAQPRCFAYLAMGAKDPTLPIQGFRKRPNSRVRRDALPTCRPVVTPPRPHDSPSERLA